MSATHCVNGPKPKPKPTKMLVSQHQHFFLENKQFHGPTMQKKQLLLHSQRSQGSSHIMRHLFQFYVMEYSLAQKKPFFFSIEQRLSLNLGQNQRSSPCFRESLLIPPPLKFHHLPPIWLGWAPPYQDPHHNKTLAKMGGHNCDCAIHSI